MTLVVRPSSSVFSVELCVSPPETESDVWPKMLTSTKGVTILHSHMIVSASIVAKITNYEDSLMTEQFYDTPEHDLINNGLWLRHRHRHDKNSDGLISMLSPFSLLFSSSLLLFLSYFPLISFSLLSSPLSSRLLLISHTHFLRTGIDSDTWNLKVIRPSSSMSLFLEYEEHKTQEDIFRVLRELFGHSVPSFESFLGFSTLSPLLSFI